LDKFCAEFATEDRLRRVFADLLTKMGKESVRVTHGPTEKGKDIVFYGPGGLGERRLFACVVKNVRITGSISSRSNAKEVLNQAEQAFAEPYLNLSGKEERVDSVYIISPFEPPLSAVASIQHQLTKVGPIEFFCGRRLLDLFVRYWPSFLWFESTILESYLCGVRSDLNRDSAIASLILKETCLAELPRSFADMYVVSDLRRRLYSFNHSEVLRLSPGLFSETFTLEKIENLSQGLRLLQSLVPCAPIWDTAFKRPKAQQILHDLRAIEQALVPAWKQAFRKRAREVHQSRTTTALAAVSTLSEDSVSLKLQVPEDVLSSYEELGHEIEALRASLKSAVDCACEFAAASHKAPLTAIRSQSYLKYCRIADLAKLVPAVVAPIRPEIQTLTLGGAVIDECDRSLLIVGPAGYGKTSFCKFHALKDAQNLLHNRSNVLPVFVPLHTLSNSSFGTVENTFFRSPDLQKLLAVRQPSSIQPQKIRLYLDGLDEVGPRSTQARIVNLARSAIGRIPGLQIVLTARDHILGPWLGWLPRVEISELTRRQCEVLASKWLSRRCRLRKQFFEQLDNGSPLGPLMSVPLLAMLILAVYRKTGTLPPNKAKLYSLFVELLCGGWDLVKGVKRDSRFGSQDKVTVLTRFAAILHLQGLRDGSESNLKTAVDATLSGFSRKWKILLDELLEDGLVVRIGAHVCFAHLSFQEFLVANDLNDPTGYRPRQAITHFFKGNNWWREILLFYLALSTRPLDMEDWIIRCARDSSEPKDVLTERVEVLRSGLYSAHPGYSSPFKDVPILDLTRDINVLRGKEWEYQSQGPAGRDEALVEMQWFLDQTEVAPEERD